MGMQVVVGIDGSQPAERALVWAAEAASRDHGLLVIAHGGAAVPEEEAVEGDYTSGLLRDAVATAIDVGDDCNVTTVLRAAQPAQLLLELSNDAQMVVVGTHGTGRVVGALLGSVANRVTAHARCPVIVVPEGWRAPAADESPAVAVGVSNSESGHEALEFALAEAERRNTTLIAVRSASELDSEDDPARPQQQQLLAEVVEEATARHPGVKVVAELASESPYDALLAVAARADLLVLGCRHDDEHRFSRLGPLAAKLLHTSPCPVAIVGHPAATEPETAAADQAFESA